MLEPLKLLWRQLSPWTVSRQEYALLRRGLCLCVWPAGPRRPGRGGRQPAGASPGGGSPAAHGRARPPAAAGRPLGAAPCASRPGRPRAPLAPPPTLLSRRASFFLSHAPDPPLEKGGFHPYLLEAAERDGASVVGLGLITWLFIIAFVLVSSE